MIGLLAVELIDGLRVRAGSSPQRRNTLTQTGDFVIKICSVSLLDCIVTSLSRLTKCTRHFIITEGDFRFFVFRVVVLGAGDAERDCVEIEVEVVGDQGSDTALVCETTQYGIAKACRRCCSEALSVE